MGTFEALGRAWPISTIIPYGHSTIILRLFHTYSIGLHIPREGSKKLSVGTLSTGIFQERGQQSWAKGFYELAYSTRGVNQVEQSKGTPWTSIFHEKGRYSWAKGCRELEYSTRGVNQVERSDSMNYLIPWEGSIKLSVGTPWTSIFHDRGQ